MNSYGPSAMGNRNAQKAKDMAEWVRTVLIPEMITLRTQNESSQGYSLATEMAWFWGDVLARAESLAQALEAMHREAGSTVPSPCTQSSGAI